MNLFNSKFTLDELVDKFRQYLGLYEYEENPIVKDHLKAIVEEYISLIKSLFDSTFDYEEDNNGL